MADYQRSDYYFSRNHSGIPPTPSDAPLKGWGVEFLSMVGFVAFIAIAVYVACRF